MFQYCNNKNPINPRHILKNLTKSPDLPILHSKIVRYLLFLSIFFSIITLVFSLFAPPNQDEGVFLTIAKNLPQKIPYRDFFDHKPPGFYLLLKPLIILFKNNIALIRLLSLATNIFSASLIYAIANRYQKNSGFLALTAFLILTPLFQGTFLFAEAILGLLIILSIYLYIKSTENNSTFLVIISAITITLSLAIKQTALINLLVMIAFYIKYQNKKQRLTALITIASTIVVMLLYLIQAGLLGLFWNQAIITNFRSYPPEKIVFVTRNLFALTWPSLLILAFAPLYFIFRKHQKIPLIIILSALLPIPIFLIRHYPHYWLQILPLLSIISVFSIQNLSKSAKKLSSLPIVFLISAITFVSWFNFIQVTNNLFTSYIPKNQEIKKARNYVESTNSHKILAENQFTYFYYNLNKTNLNKYLYITEITDKEGDAEQKTIENLKKDKDDVIILWPTDQNYPYAKNLQNYINQNFVPSESYNNINLTIYKKSI